MAVAADPALARPAVAEATIDLNGRVVQAQAAGQTVRAAIEQVASRLEIRLGRAGSGSARRRQISDERREDIRPYAEVKGRFH